MIVKLFDFENGQIKPSEHCYVLKWLSDIMDEYKDDEEYLKVYAFLFYMTCPNPDLNPYFHYQESNKEEDILKDIDANFSPEENLIVRALERCGKMYETPTSRAYYGIAGMLDKLALYMRVTSIADGRDGNITGIISAAKNFDQIRNSFKGAYKDLQEEQQSRNRGGKGLAYDQ